MLVYRLCKDKYSNLDGEGASKVGGSWNSRGKPVIYTSENISLTVLEILVHIDYDLIPDDYVLLTINIPDEIKKQSGPSNLISREKTMKFGDEWLVSKKSLILSVPSHIINKENNYLINPNHSDFLKVSVLSKEFFKFDNRLSKA